MNTVRPYLTLALQKVRPYAKAAVAVGGLVVVVGNQSLSGELDSDALITAGTAVMVAFGVYRVPNRA